MFRVARHGQEFLEINEDNLHALAPKNTKYHLIKINLQMPDRFIMKKIISIFPQTNRFIVNDHIRFYNGFFKEHNKKYYVENQKDEPLISFFKKNNKCCLNFMNVPNGSGKFAVTNMNDILKNLEVIIIDNELYSYIEKSDIIPENWQGNIVIV